MNAPTKKWPAAIVLCALLGLGSASATAQLWISQGPAAAINGQVEGVMNGTVTGAIEAVVAHPTNGNILWIGAVNGGIWRTDDAGNPNPTWIPQTDSYATLSISALELDPTDAGNNTLVAGTGRRSAYNSNGGAVVGLLRTTDGGATWTQLSNGIGGVWVSGVAPRGATIVLSSQLANDFNLVGVHRSVDTGATFVQVSGANGTGLPAGSAFDLVGDPTNAARLFTVIQDFNVAANSGIYRSDDSGATWTKISDATQDGLLNAGTTDANIAVGRAGPAAPNVFSAICNNGALAGLHRTADGSVGAPVWTALDLPQTMENGMPRGVHTGGQCDPHFSLAADPVNANVAYVGGDVQPNPLPNSIGANDFSGRLFRIDAGQGQGNQATPITHCSGAMLPAGCNGVQSTANNSAPHGDSREMVFDAFGDLIEVDDGGIYVRTGLNGTMGDWVSLIGNLAVTEQHDAVHDSISNIIISGNQDTGVTQQMAAGAIWDSRATADGGDVVVAEGDPVANQSTRYYSTQNLGGLTREVYDAANVLQSVQAPQLTPVMGDPALVPQFTTPLAVNAITPTRMLAGGGNGMYESADRLDTITLITAAVANEFGSNPVAYGAAGNADVLYFASQDDVYWRTAAPPTAPVMSDPDAASDDNITSVVIDPDNPNTAFAVDFNQVFFTANAAATWVDVTGNLLTLNPGALRTVEYINLAPDRLVVGADTGVFVATEAGGFTTWTELGTGLPNTLVYDLDFDPVTSSLAAGTLGRGAWKLSLAAGCPANLAIGNQTITGAVTHQATTRIDLGPNLILNGTAIVMRSPNVVIGNGTRVRGTFSANNATTCP